VRRLVDHQDRTEANDSVENDSSKRRRGRHLPLHRFGYPSDCDTFRFWRYYGGYKKKIHSFVGGPLFIHFSMDFSSISLLAASGLFMTAFKWKLRLGGGQQKHCGGIPDAHGGWNAA
jgi:hypothetical protein